MKVELKCHHICCSSNYNKITKLEMYEAIMLCLKDLDDGKIIEGKIALIKLKQDADCEARYFYLYFNESKYTIEKEYLTVIANKNYIEGKELIGKEITDEYKDLYPYCIFKKDDKNIVTSIDFNQELFNENLKQSGYFVIVSSLDMEPSKMLDEYRNRDSIEKCFRTLKTELGFSKL